ncbi:MAG: hypothetical protein OEW33_09570 [Nitrospirota bacterium]|nr:hypothetical protein [Nitrospirota bacterium]
MGDGEEGPLFVRLAFRDQWKLVRMIDEINMNVDIQPIGGELQGARTKGSGVNVEPD